MVSAWSSVNVTDGSLTGYKPVLDQTVCVFVSVWLGLYPILLYFLELLGILLMTVPPTSSPRQQNENSFTISPANVSNTRLTSSVHKFFAKVKKRMQNPAIKDRVDLIFLQVRICLVKPNTSDIVELLEENTLQQNVSIIIKEFYIG